MEEKTVNISIPTEIIGKLMNREISAERISIWAVYDQVIYNYFVI